MKTEYERINNLLDIDKCSVELYNILKRLKDEPAFVEQWISHNPFNKFKP